MSNFAKNIWAIFLATLTFGIWTFPIILVLIIISLVTSAKKPD